MNPRPIVWSIAGSDPSGGAGLQADLKTFQALGVYGCAAVTALTVQNTRGVRRVEPVAPDLLRGQLQALREDLPPVAVKVGMLGSAANLRVVAALLRELDTVVVCDPVLAATAGPALLEADGPALLRTELLPQVDLLTPNLPEAAALLGCPAIAAAETEAAAAALRALGPAAVLLKGGHRDGPLSQDYFTDGREGFWLSSPRRAVSHTHGTGCTLAAALAACRALGYPWAEAVVWAKAYVNQGLRLGGGIGSGRGPLAHAGWPDDPADRPQRTEQLVHGGPTDAPARPS